MQILLFMLIMVFIMSIVYKIGSFILRAIFGDILGRLITLFGVVTVVYLMYQSYHPYF